MANQNRVCLPLRVENGGEFTDPNVSLQLTIPAGLQLVTNTIPSGDTFDGVDTWDLGEQVPGQIDQANFCFEVIDEDEDCTVMWNVTGDLLDPDSTNNSGSKNLKPAPPACSKPCPEPCDPCGDNRPSGGDYEVAECVIDASQAFTQKCSCGCRNLYVLEDETNGSGAIDPSTGIWRGEPDDGSAPVSISVSLRCVDCPGDCGPEDLGGAGPFTITTPAKGALDCSVMVWSIAQKVVSPLVTMNAGDVYDFLTDHPEIGDCDNMHIVAVSWNGNEAVEGVDLNVSGTAITAITDLDECFLSLIYQCRVSICDGPDE